MAFKTEHTENYTCTHYVRDSYSAHITLRREIGPIASDPTSLRDLAVHFPSSDRVPAKMTSADIGVLAYAKKELDKSENERKLVLIAPEMILNVVKRTMLGKNNSVPMFKDIDDFRNAYRA